MNLEGKELEKYWQQVEAQHERDIAWMKERGWIEHPPEDPKNESSTWTHPKHGDRIYTWLHCEVVDTAEMDLVHELGWVCVSQQTMEPDFHAPHKPDLSDLQYREDREWNDETRDHTGKPVIWGRYVHPISGKIYTYLEARDIARFYNNSEEEWLADGNKPSGWHEQVQALLGNRRLEKDDVLWLKFGPKDPPTNMENVYSLLRIERKPCSPS